MYDKISSSTNPLPSMQLLEIDGEYGRHYRPVEELIQAALPASKHYWRVAGYFRSSVFNIIGDEIKEFCLRGGSIRLLTSVELTEDDERAMQAGENRRSILEGALERSLEDAFDSPLSNPELLEELIANGSLEVKISIGDFEHRKKGIFFSDDTSRDSEYIAFSGTINDSANGFRNQKNDIDVFCNWKSKYETQKAKTKYDCFLLDWEDKQETVTLSLAQARKIIRRAGSGFGGQAGVPATEDDGPYVPEAIDPKWAHQEEAVDAFLEAEGNGVLAMATGTGKTRTAGKIIRRLMQENEIDGVVVVTDNGILLDQWGSQFREKEDYPEIDGTVYDHYNSGGASRGKESNTFRYSPEGMLLIGRHFFSDFAKSLEKDEVARVLLILDEAHKFKGDAFRETIGVDNIKKFKWRLGLSATPYFGLNEEGNTFLQEAMGEIFYNFNIEDAIKKGILCPITYTPLDFALSAADRLEKSSIWADYENRKNTDDPMPLKEARMKSARVTKKSTEKIPVFEKFLLSKNPSLNRTIIFVEEISYGEEVCKILRNHIPGKYRTFFQDENTENLQRFIDGELECLVTCARIAEGVDIPSVSQVILFTADRHPSSKNYQRIGRALRIVEENPDKRAIVIDFLTEGREEPINNDGEKSSCQLRYEWLTELSKIEETE